MNRSSTVLELPNVAGAGGAAGKTRCVELGRPPDECGDDGESGGGAAEKAGPDESGSCGGGASAPLPRSPSASICESPTDGACDLSLTGSIVAPICEGCSAGAPCSDGASCTGAVGRAAVGAARATSMRIGARRHRGASTAAITKWILGKSASRAAFDKLASLLASAAWASNTKQEGVQRKTHRRGRAEFSLKINQEKSTACGL